MRKVKVIISFSAMFGSYAAGEVVELAETDAEEMIRCGYCAPVDAEKEGKADAVRDKNPAIKGTNKPNRRKAAPTG